MYLSVGLVYNEKWLQTQAAQEVSSENYGKIKDL